MAELVARLDTRDRAGSSGPRVDVNLWCTPCGTTHELALPDVERIVYALSAMVATESGLYPVEFHRSCLREVLGEANTGQLYLGLVTEAVANREQARRPVPPAPHPVPCPGCGSAKDASRYLCPDCQREYDQWREDGSAAPVAVVGPWSATRPFPGYDDGQAITDGAALDAERAGRCQL